MKKQLFALSVILCALTSCENSKNPTSPAGEQSVGRVDLESDRINAQKIRQALAEDPSLSDVAKEVKVISVNGVVTLRGTVPSESEKRRISKLIKGITSVRSIDNQLKVSSPENENSAGIQEGQ